MDDRSWPEHLPPLEMCEAHWGQYDRDWLLLGWCVNHYGEALAQCPVHEQVIEPL